VIYRGVEYTVTHGVEPDVWQWCFQIGGVVSTGRTRTMLSMMAARRAQLQINVALRGIEAAMNLKR
jgi:hypothetical protein